MKHYKAHISREEVSALLNYDPVTGIFKHKVDGHKRKAGAVAGRLDTKGYVRIRLFGGQEFKAHRLAWLMIYGVWPEAEIDHINGCPSDNRIINLRDVSVAENGWNRKSAMKNNQLGVLGVCLVNGKYYAQIGANGTNHCLGLFDTLEEATEARAAAKQLLHTVA